MKKERQSSEAVLFSKLGLGNPGKKKKILSSMNSKGVIEVTLGLVWNIADLYVQTKNDELYSILADEDSLFSLVNMLFSTQVSYVKAKELLSEMPSTSQILNMSVLPGLQSLEIQTVLQDCLVYYLNKPYILSEFKLNKELFYIKCLVRLRHLITVRDPLVYISLVEEQKG